MRVPNASKPIEGRQFKGIIIVFGEENDPPPIKIIALGMYATCAYTRAPSWKSGFPVQSFSLIGIDWEIKRACKSFQGLGL